MSGREGGKKKPLKAPKKDAKVRFQVHCFSVFIRYKSCYTTVRQINPCIIRVRLLFGFHIFDIKCCVHHHLIFDCLEHGR